MVQLQKINDLIVCDELHKITCPFSPIALPIDDQLCITNEEAATNVGYATLVYSVLNKSFMVFEFGQDIFEGLSAYNARHGTVENLELLLSREADGALRMTLGSWANNKPEKTLLEEYSVINDTLYTVYLSKKMGKPFQDLK